MWGVDPSTRNETNLYFRRGLKQDYLHTRSEMDNKERIIPSSTEPKSYDA